MLSPPNAAAAAQLLSIFLDCTSHVCTTTGGGGGDSGTEADGGAADGSTGQELVPAAVAQELSTLQNRGLGLAERLDTSTADRAALAAYVRHLEGELEAK